MGSKVDRDARLCADYEGGLKVAALVDKYKISHQRVRQILKREGIAMRDDRPEPQGLDNFIGVNISDEDKAALKSLAETEGLSTASLTRQWIKEKLAQLRTAS